jgi:TrmH family RNA methyltransferase
MVFRTPIVAGVGGEMISRLAEARVPILVADASGRDVRSVPRSGGWALAVGNEGAGVRTELREAAGAVVRVPMPGAAESLNAAVAGAILLYALTLEEELAD